MQRWKIGTLLLATAALATTAHKAAAQTLDTSSIWTLQGENDAVSTLKGTSDQYYTSGLRLGWTSGQDQVGPIADFGRDFWSDGTTRLSLELSQSLFTPHNTQISPPNPKDRPYAGLLLATADIIHDSTNTRDVLAFTAGVLGPDAQGEEVQNGFHNLIGDTPNKGWRYQRGNEPALNILAQRTWRLPITSVGGFETDLLPSATIAGGDVRDYLQLGTIARIGQGLNSDFGTARIAPGLNGSDAYTATRRFVWYAFAGVDGQAVGYDTTLNKSLFGGGTQTTVQRTWDVGEMEAGLAIMAYGLRLTYTQTWQAQEFHGARSGLFNFGSLALSAKF